MFKFTFDTRELWQTMRRIDGFKIEIPQIAGRQIVKQINDLAAISVAPNGNQWVRLSPAYAKKVKRTNATKKVTGAFLASVKNRGMFIAPDEAHVAQGMGLEKLRVSFDVSPSTSEAILDEMLQWWNKIFR